MLAVMVFALVIGLAMTTAPEKCQGFIAFLEGLNVIAMVVIEFAMKLAPICAGCLVFAITAQLGLDVIRTLLAFALTVIGGLVLQLFVIYPIAFLPVGLAYFARWALDSQAAFFGVLAIDAALGLVFYKIALDSAVEAADRLKEKIVTALSRGDGPIAA